MSGTVGCSECLIMDCMLGEVEGEMGRVARGQGELE